jgi:hypothetical protein
MGKKILILIVLFNFFSQISFSNSLHETLFKTINTNDPTNKIKFDFNNDISIKKLNNMIIINSVFVSTGSVFATAGLIMGFIPVQKINSDFNKPQNDAIGFVYYPYMLVYSCVGISLIAVGVAMFLVCLPILIYALVKKNKSDDISKNKANYSLPKVEIGFKF